MNLSSLLGIFGTVIGLVRALPQLVSLLRSKGALGVSVDTAATSAIVSYGWAIYGVLTAQPYVALATGSAGTIFLIITFVALRFGRQLKELKVAPIWLCVLVFASILARDKGLGVILPISILVSNIPHLWIAYKEEDLTDLSLGTWLLSMADGLVWGLYSFVENDISIMVFAFFQLSTSGLIVAFKLFRKRTGQNEALPVVPKVSKNIMVIKEAKL